MQYRSQKIFAVLFLILSAITFSCGYKFAGSGKLPEGVERVNITLFKNNTIETGLENTLTNDLIYEFTRSGKTVYSEKDRSEAVISGAIRSIKVDSASRSNARSSVERRVTITADLKITARDGRVLWSAKGVSEKETFAVEEDKQATEKNMEDALKAASKRLAEHFYRSMTDDF